MADSLHRLEMPLGCYIHSKRQWFINTASLI